MPIEVPFSDLEGGKYYKLRDHYILSAQQQGNGTLQEDIDRISARFYMLRDGYEFGDDAEFELAPGEAEIDIPEVNGVNNPFRSRDYIFISSFRTLPEGDDTIFLEEEPENVQIPGLTNNDPIQTNNIINLTGSSGGRRKRRMSKKRKTMKKRKNKKTRKQKSRKH